MLRDVLSSWLDTGLSSRAGDGMGAGCLSGQPDADAAWQLPQRGAFAGDGPGTVS
jgi:hypothetical protein